MLHLQLVIPWWLVVFNVPSTARLFRDEITMIANKNKVENMISGNNLFDINIS